MTGRRGRRRRKLRMTLRKRGYWKLKEGATNRTWWRTRFAKRLWTCRKTGCGITIPSLPCISPRTAQVHFTLSGHGCHQIHTQSLYLQLAHLDIHGTGWSLRKVESLPLSGEEPQQRGLSVRNLFSLLLERIDKCNK